MKECSHCGEIIFLEQFLKRNSQFLEEQVETYWINNENLILCDTCLNDKYQKKINNLDKIFTPIAIIFLCVSVFCLVFFTFTLWFLEEIIKPIATSEKLWIGTIFTVIVIYLLFVRALRPFKTMVKKIK